MEPPNDAGYIISIHAPREGSDLAARAHPGVGGISIHAPREGSDTSQLSRPARHRRFLSTLPARGATLPADPQWDAGPISIHAPREGSDGRRRAPRPAGRYFYPRSPRGERPIWVWALSGSFNFYPRSPRGERQLAAMMVSSFYLYFYPRSPRGERPVARGLRVFYHRISIHAPREGSDICLRYCASPSTISIHAPREGSDPGHPHFGGQHPDFYPRSPRGERRPPARTTSSGSIFLSTLPARGATSWLGGAGADATISIHAPREGSDRPGQLRRSGKRHFYPRSPRGERPGPQDDAPAGGKNFYPRSPRGERHFAMSGTSMASLISIHAPREGSDPPSRCGAPGGRYFYPRSPRGERPIPNIVFSPLIHFYPRSPRGERRVCRQYRPRRLHHFYPRSPRGERPAPRRSCDARSNFYPRSPRGERPAGG